MKMQFRRDQANLFIEENNICILKIKYPSSMRCPKSCLVFWHGWTIFSAHMLENALIFANIQSRLILFRWKVKYRYFCYTSNLASWTGSLFMEKNRLLRLWNSTCFETGLHRTLSTKKMYYNETLLAWQYIQWKRAKGIFHIRTCTSERKPGKKIRKWQNTISMRRRKKK